MASKVAVYTRRKFFNFDLTAKIEKLLVGETPTDDKRFSSVINIQEQSKAQFAAMGDIFAVVAAGILAVTTVIVILTLYMVIKATIIQRKSELGIQKALGFTTFQLMSKIALNFTPIILFGVMLGAVGGYFGLNPLFVALTKSISVVRANLSSPLCWTLMTELSLTVLAYIVSMLVAWRIRKITAYSLICE